MAGASQRLLPAFQRGDLEAARREQFRSVQLMNCSEGYGYMGAAKATLKMVGVDVGPARLRKGSKIIAASLTTGWSWGRYWCGVGKKRVKT